MNKYEIERWREQMETTFANFADAAERTALAMQQLARGMRCADVKTSVEHEGGLDDADDFTPSDN
ncbi:MAG: hypothetical protein ACOC8X_07080 [Chloroflexota bacterium]